MTDYINVEVTITLSYPVPADPEVREAYYGTADLAECVQIDFDSDGAAMLMESTIIDMQVHV